MSISYILKSTENEYLIVMRVDDVKKVIKIIDYLSLSSNVEIKELAVKLEKSLNDDGNRRDTSKARSKNKSKSTTSNNSRRRKTKDS
jgi:hypothetical protein